MRAIFVLFLGFVLLLPVSAAASPRPSNSCQNIHFTVEGYAVPDATGLAVFSITVAGDLAGSSISGHVTVVNATPGGATHFGGTHTFVTPSFGTFTTTDTIIVTPSGTFNAVFDITDGASGAIKAHGTIDAAGNINGAYHGRVCS